jgi:hypothetical protein
VQPIFRSLASALSASFRVARVLECVEDYRRIRIDIAESAYDGVVCCNGAREFRDVTGVRVHGDEIGPRGSGVRVPTDSGHKMPAASASVTTREPTLPLASMTAIFMSILAVGLTRG